MILLHFIKSQQVFTVETRREETSPERQEAAHPEFRDEGFHEEDDSKDAFLMEMKTIDHFALILYIL